jgi:hypothetical protein
VSFLVGIIVAIVLVVLFVKLALGVLGIVVALALAVGAYFLAEKITGPGR